MPQEYKYFAFISYNSRDTAWGKRLQRRLEGYKLPTTLCRERGLKRKPLKPVFFAPTDIQPGDLSEELKQRLRDSRNLIVICSPHSAQSEWVGKEIAYFHSLGRTQEIHFFIVAGVPNSGDEASECFNPIVKELGMPEILAANVHEKVFRLPWLNRERAYAQLISKLLGVEFDTIWKRHRRRLIARAISTGVLVLAVAGALSAVWKLNQPVDVAVRVSESGIINPLLPGADMAVVSLSTDKESKRDTLRSLPGEAKFPNVPAAYIGKKVRLSFACTNFIPLDTTLVAEREMDIKVRRAPEVFGCIRFRIWDMEKETYLGAGHSAEVCGQKLTPDKDGYFTLDIPLPSQAPFHRVKADIALENDTIYMPCGENAVLFTK